MADLILWNSIAKRRHSPSDTFLENGLGMLKSFIEKQGFKVEIIDWARSNQWDKMTPGTLARINRCMAAVLWSSNGSGKRRGKTISRLVSPLFLLSQGVMSNVQKRLQERMIRELARYIHDSGCQVLGIKSWYGEAFPAAKYLARCVRKLAPEVLIVVGGPHASIYRDAVLEDSVFDVAVVGEGERALSAILALARQTKTREKLLQEIAWMVSLGQLKNVIFRNNRGIGISAREQADANSKVVPCYDLLEGKTLIHVVVDSLGCPWGKCNFCSHSCIYQKHSLRKAQSVVDEIGEMVSRGIGIFRFAGSSTALAHACDIAALLDKSGLRVLFSMFARAEPGASEDIVYSRLVDSYGQLLRSGLRAVFIGAESGIDLINYLVMNKGLALGDITATVRAMREASQKERLPLDIGLSLIYPAPTVCDITLEQLKIENIKLIEQTGPDSVLVSPPAPFPGTAWFKEKDRFGFELGERFVQEILEYEYALYKPPSLWPEIDLKLKGMSLREILEECQDLRGLLEEKGFVTEVTDEHFLMMRAAGYLGKEGAVTFKNQALLSLISCDYRWMNRVQERVNQASLAQALINKR
ncbi:MAG TPA: cobalamin-dependent protein [archaeon]|nr:cobalamin-dependent protein [archaeon]